MILVESPKPGYTTVPIFILASVQAKTFFSKSKNYLHDNVLNEFVFAIGILPNEWSRYDQ